MENFTALDFETATRNPESICQIGLVRYENGEVVHQVDMLVQPPNNLYHPKNVEIHGITPQMTITEPLFEEAWFKIKPFIDDHVVVAHNISFDANCLRNALAYYDIALPYFEERCTRMIYKKGLAFLAKKYKINLNHHDALSDAKACAELYIMHLRRQNLPKTGSLF